MELLQALVTIFAENGYAAVLIALLICGFGLPLPEDITLVAGGVISGLGYTNVHVMFFVAMGGVLAGDATIFMLGHHFGPRTLNWRFINRLMTPRRYALVQEKFDRYGNRLLFLARFLPGLRTTVYFTAGSTHRVSVWRFLLIDAMAAVISVPLWVYLGYFGANNHEWLTTWLRRGQNGLWGLVAILVVALAIMWWRHHRRSRCRPD